MQLGFFTACLPGLDLDDIAGWVASNGFHALEVAARPDLGDRSFTASHHEDPVWGGDEDRVKAGLEIARLALRPLIVR